MFTEDTERLFTAYRIIGTKWTIHILCILSQGPKKFGEISESIPSLSEMILSRRLKDLQHDNLVKRTILTRPAQIIYELTPKGAALATFIPCLMDWDTKFQNDTTRED
ncbi:helix-turn-helix transcriptional regulator [Paenibacillus sp. JNUCC31]|uniref:winged helix-turn-helix transcriptional regulator n=1 Tax=Paenibacillus sp. JNUCC-31 TaxID=2777983 RepID=UPI0017850D09|nr:helix-turn-helix domain-containing protein [Paenibacillus sp. JNUCC-31]QOS79483.1 helix-turn-helix transcriptional regulator [Paenibacillus sp. JNUCC-31]